MAFKKLDEYGDTITCVTDVVKDIEVLDVSHMSKKIIRDGTDEVELKYYYTEISSKNVDKWFALEKLAEKLNITSQEIMAIGDNVNDKMMMEKAGLGVAMGNSAPYIKEFANDISTQPLIGRPCNFFTVFI